jgi:hypothetical protein
MGRETLGKEVKGAIFTLTGMEIAAAKYRWQ